MSFAAYECCKCGHRWKQPPQIGTTIDDDAPQGFRVFEHYMAQCPECQSAYICWLNFKDFEVIP